MAINFTNDLLEIFSAHIPYQDHLVKPKDGIWFNVNIKTEINKRDKLYKKYRKDNNQMNYTRFRCQAEVVNNLVIESKNKHREQLCEKLTTHSTGKNYWFVIKKLLGTKFSYVIPSLENNGVVAMNDVEKATMFLEHFVGKFQHRHDINNLPNCPIKTRSVVNIVNIDRFMVHRILMDLDISKSNGDDNISNRMLKLASESIDSPLHLLFNKILECWKCGTLVPIFKNKGSRNSVKNYRPVTLLNTIPKIFERIIYESILRHVTDNNLLFVNQAGFLKGHDTQKQLLEIVHMIKTNITNKSEMRGIFLDIEGAFDAIPHFLLLHKLKSLGIGPSITKLLKSYLMDRTLRAKVNNCYSEWSQPGEVNCGVPQGSILGPLLFLLYINDLSQAVHNCTLHLYADDSSLFFPIHLNDNVYLAHRLIQDDLHRMEKWSEKWKLNFKAAKSKEVLFSPPGKASRNHPSTRKSLA
jgi:hypothetical protein